MTLPGIGRLGVLALAWSALAAPDTAMAATDVADQSFPALFLQGLRYREFFQLYAAISLAIGIYLTLGGFRKSSRS